MLATNAIVGPLTTIGDEHKKETGQQVNVEFDTSTSISRRFAAGTLTSVNVLIGMTQISEVIRAQEDTGGAVVLRTPAPRESARVFGRRLVTPAARKILAANGWEF